jgi:methanogenic corrinoid protein MtbC1
MQRYIVQVKRCQSVRQGRHRDRTPQSSNQGASFIMSDSTTPATDLATPPSATRQSVHLSISAVERDTGLSKDTLRVWERRYGFPTPERDGFGERAYPMEQVERLRIIKRLLDAGHRPGRVVALDLPALQHLAEGMSTLAGRPSLPTDSDDLRDLHGFIDLIKAHDIEALRRTLSQAQLRLGLARFVTDLVAPLNTMVGDAWMRGHLEVFEEHMYTESIQVVLRNALNAVPEPELIGRPRVLLTTFPQEQHALGLLMAEATLALEGCKCLSLGTQTPIWDIALAATAHRADIVALSFTACQNPNQVIEGLVDLRSKMPRSVDIWAGGSCPILYRRAIEGVRTLTELHDVPVALGEWRQAHARGFAAAE